MAAVDPASPNQTLLPKWRQHVSIRGGFECAQERVLNYPRLFDQLASRWRPAAGGGRAGNSLQVSLVARVLSVAAVLCAATGPVHAAEEASPVTLRGDWCQGHLIRGQTDAGAQAWLNGDPLRVSESGAFVFGFSRDEAGKQTLKVRRADGSLWQYSEIPCTREYKIQRIDGLPSKQVTPDEKSLKRIREEGALAAAARKQDADDESVFAEFIWPAKGPISGVYGSQRILNGQPRRPHFGVDVAAPTGTPVVAPAAGVVRMAHPDMYFSGGTLIVDHGFGVTSSFLHLSKIVVKEGERVEQGQKIAEIGATGRVTGPHLDWRMNWFKVRVDPQPLVGDQPPG